MNPYRRLSMGPREKACGDKKRYSNKEKAEREVRRMKHPYLKAYFCEHCRRWHTGRLMGHISHMLSREEMSSPQTIEE